MLKYVFFIKSEKKSYIIPAIEIVIIIWPALNKRFIIEKLISFLLNLPKSKRKETPASNAAILKSKIKNAATSMPNPTDTFPHLGIFIESFSANISIKRKINISMKLNCCISIVLIKYKAKIKPINAIDIL
nr:hypothetical protein [Carboxydothermus ferrireducens]